MHPFRIAFALLLLGLPGSSLAQPSAFTMVRPVLRVPPNTDPIGEVILRVSAAEAAKATNQGQPILKDTTPAAGEPAKLVTVDFEPAEPMAVSNTADRQFRFRGRVSGLAANSLLKRTAVVEWGGGTTAMEYWISSFPPPTLQWSVSGLPAKWAVDDGHCFPVRLSAFGARATGIMVTSTLVEKTTMEPIVAPFLSLDKKETADPPVLEAAVNDAGTAVYLCFPKNIASGEYSGDVTISAAEKPAGETRAVAIYATSWAHRWWGLATVIIGCALAFLVRAWLPTRINRSVALMAAAVVRSDAQGALDELTALVAKKTRLELQRVINELREENLISMIPSGVPAAVGVGPDAVAFKTFIDLRASKVFKLQLITDAIGRATDDAMIAKLDLLAEDLDITQDALKQAIKAILFPPQATESPATTPDLPERSEKEILIDIKKAQVTLWVVWTLVTIAVGFVMLVWGKPGFGVPNDFMYCLFWGLGIPVAGQPIAGSSVTAALGVTFK